jgi:hypothetical protein
MTDERTHDLEALLTQAEDAHGVYETGELNGVYDEDWARWYAAYLVEHGIGRLVGREIDVESLTTFLSTSWHESQGSEASGEPWAAATARRIVTRL